jgi:hypothetical protein
VYYRQSPIGFEALSAAPTMSDVSSLTDYEIPTSSRTPCDASSLLTQRNNSYRNDNVRYQLVPRDREISPSS